MAGTDRPKKASRGWLKVLLTILVVMLGLILLVLLAVTIYWNAMLNKINRMDETVAATLSEAEIQEIMDEVNDPNAEDTTYPTDPLVTDEEDYIANEDTILNIMLLGQDIRTKGTNRRGRTDTMILCTINTEAKTITFTSFLRDIYVKLPDFDGKQWGYNRLNANYVFGGAEMLDQCMQMNFGIDPEYFVVVDFDAFIEVIDLLGGVEIELTDTEAWCLNLGVPSWRLKGGLRRLTGEQAAAYARIREIDGNFQRSVRHRNLLNSLMVKFKQMSPTQLHQMLSTALPYVTTDMTNDEITKYALMLIPMVGELEVRNFRIPIDGSYYHANKGTAEKPRSVLAVDLEANREALRQFLGDDALSKAG